MSDGGKGSSRRPGKGYQDAWERIFGNKTLEQEVFEHQVKPFEDGLAQALMGNASTASGVLPVAGAEQEHREQSVPHHPKGGGTLPVREAASAST
jgi:hypothetical protein